MSRSIRIFRRRSPSSTPTARIRRHSPSWSSGPLRTNSPQSRTAWFRLQLLAKANDALFGPKLAYLLDRRRDKRSVISRYRTMAGQFSMAGQFCVCLHLRREPARPTAFHSIDNVTRQCDILHDHVCSPSQRFRASGEKNKLKPIWLQGSETNFQPSSRSSAACALHVFRRVALKIQSR
jgi:hypothetical protein